MSVVLMIYSFSACREFVLPSLHNEEYALSIDSDVFGLKKDIILLIEEEKGDWYFLPDENYNIKGADEDIKESRIVYGRTFSSGKEPHSNSKGMVDLRRKGNNTGFASYYPDGSIGGAFDRSRYGLSENNFLKVAEDFDSDKRLRLVDGANYTLYSGEERLAIIIRYKETSFVSYRKYNLGETQKVSIGCKIGNIIRYSYSFNGNQYIGRNMATILVSNEDAILVDEKSKNGLYVNDRRVRESVSLNFGDHIHIWGLDMVYLGKILAIREDKDLEVDISVLRPYKENKSEIIDMDDSGGVKSAGSEAHIPAQPEDAVPFKKTVFHRSPRSMEAIDTQKMEIEQPPSPREVPEPNLMLTIGPSMTMAIPMAMGSGLAILGTRMTGGTASLFMYTGIITAIGAAVIGAFWALMNLNYNQKKAKQDEIHRFEAYSEYLIRCSDKLKHSYINNANALRKMYPSAGVCVTPQMEEQNLLWGRNSTHGDFLAHRVGRGDIPFQVEIDVPKERFTLLDDSLNEKPRMIRDSYQTLHDVPICIDLLRENIIGIVGGEGKAGAYEVFYDLVAQIAAQNSYTDVKMAFLFSGEGDHERGREKWDFLRWLPHTWSQDRRIRYFASGKSEITDVLYALSRILRDRSEQQKGTSVTGKKHIYKPHYILFVEDGSLLEGELINTFLTDRDADLGITLVIFAESYEELPNTCECIIGNEGSFQGLYRVREGTREKIAFDSVSPEALNSFARHLSNLEVNEVEVGGDIPASITFFEMYGVTKMEELGVVDRWRKNRTYTSMRALVGHMAGGAPCYLDVHEKYHGPHGLVAGTTGSGKSETLQTYILSLAINFSPDDVGFFLIDYKGGGMANLFEDLPHVMGTISNLSGNQVTRAMVSIKSENRRRQRLFNESGVNNINAYTQLYKNGEAKIPVPHLFIIIDEFAELKREQPDFMKELISVAQVGRSLGVHLILATQKPAGTVDDNIWSNSKFRLCLRVQDRQDSQDMLHKPDAAYLTQAGRCYLQVGNDELYELFQSGWSGAIYDETDANAQRTLATMLTGTGKAALMGSYIKRRQKEGQKERWIATLVDVLYSMSPEKLGQRRMEGEGSVIDRYFQLLEEEGIDYPDTEFNRRAAALLIRMARQAEEERAEWKQIDSLEKARQLIQMEAKQNGRLPERKDKTQLDAVIDYLARTAQEEGYQKPQKLWRPVLPPVIPLGTIAARDGRLVADLEQNTGIDREYWQPRPKKWALEAVIGLYDDPANQAQEPLQISFTEEGNIAVCGMQSSGRSTALQTILYSLAASYSPAYVGFYIFDFSSRILACFEEDPHCGGVLYENDTETVSKFFNMLDGEIKRRRELFSGGNYYQYVMKNGVELPVLLVAIDNYAGFREKTSCAFDEKMMQITRDCNACGIYFLLSAGGYNKDEIPNRLHDNIHYTIALEMQDQFAYSEALGVMRVPILPEGDVPGRGLASISGEILEIQMSVAAAAADDYQRGETLAEEARKWAMAWKGGRIRKIPRIPAKPTWEIFKSEPEVQNLVKDDRHLPIGYQERNAQIYAIDLSNIHTWLIQGKNRNDRKKAMQIIAKSAILRGGLVTVIEPDNTKWRSFACAEGMEYLSGFDEFEKFRGNHYQPDVLKRNAIKKECLEKDYQEEIIYNRLLEERARFLIITDLRAFIEMLHTKETEQQEIQIKNFIEKGSLLNIFIFAGLNPDDRQHIMDQGIFRAFTAPRAGIHLGGKITEQRIFDFSTMPFAEQNQPEKPGRGVVAPTETEEWQRLVLPMA